MILHGDPLLRQPLMEVSQRQLPVLQGRLIDPMFEAMYAHNGIGLAAPQIGLPYRAFVMDIGGTQAIFLNPKFVYGRGRQLSTEGCLSCPGRTVKVRRYADVCIEFRNEKWEKLRRTYTGLAAACIQHELNHLDGITILEHDYEEA